MKRQCGLDTPAITLHWVVGITILFLLATGLYMAATDAWSLYPIHKSIGVLLFFVAVTRAIRRLRAGWPAPVSQYHRIEQSLSKLTHWVLLIGSLAVPLTGMMYSGVSGHGFGLFGLVTLVPMNHSELDPSIVVPYSKYWELVTQQTHQIIAYVLVGAIALHAAGALKHHFIDRDSTLLRMLGAGSTRASSPDSSLERPVLGGERVANER
jgi:cytochrome b561